MLEKALEASLAFDAHSLCDFWTHQPCRSVQSEEQYYPIKEDQYRAEYINDCTVLEYRNGRKEEKHFREWLP